MDVTAARSRILIVITKANWGGAQRYVYDLATAAQEAGHEVTVACGMPGEMSDRLEAAHVPVVKVDGLERDIRATSDIRAFLELVKLMRALRPDVVHSNSSKVGGLASLAAKFAGVRHSIFTCHGWAFNENRPVWQKVIIGLAHYVTVLLSDTTICVSEALKRDAHWMPFVQKKFIVIHNGIGPVQLHGREEARAALAQELENRSTSLWIGTIAELHPTKQLSVAIEAFARIADKFPTAHYFIIGEGQDHEKLARLISERGLVDRVHLCGHVPNAQAYLPAFDIFVLPSRSEALGFVLLEAGMARIAAIATRVGGIPEVISNEHCGRLVKSGDGLQLSQAMTELLTHPDLRKRMGDALHTHVSQTFSLGRMVKDTLALYQ